MFVDSTSSSCSREQKLERFYHLVLRRQVGYCAIVLSQVSDQLARLGDNADFGAVRRVEDESARQRASGLGEN